MLFSFFLRCLGFSLSQSFLLVIVNTTWSRSRECRKRTSVTLGEAWPVSQQWFHVSVRLALGLWREAPAQVSSLTSGWVRCPARCFHNALHFYIAGSYLFRHLSHILDWEHLEGRGSAIGQHQPSTVLCPCITKAHYRCTVKKGFEWIKDGVTTDDLLCYRKILK